MGECHPYYQAKSTSNFDGLDRSCSYLWNGISAVEIFPSALFMGSWLACAIILLLLLTMVAWVDKKGQHLYQEL